MKEETEKVELSLVPFPTQTTNLFKLPDGSTVDLEGYLIWLGRTLLEIKRAVA